MNTNCCETEIYCGYDNGKLYKNEIGNNFKASYQINVYLRE